MGCCQKFLKQHPSGRPIICRKWVLPLRIAVVSSLIVHLLCYLFFAKQRGGLLVLLVAIHLAVAWSLLQECRRSVEFHNQLAK